MTTLATLLNLAGPDMIIILLIVLVLFGAKRLPDLARGMGQAMKEFQKAKDDLHNEIHSPPPKRLDVGDAQPANAEANPVR